MEIIEIVDKYKGPIAAALIFLFLLAWIGVLKVDNAELSGQLAKAKADVETLTFSNHALTASIQTQNAAIQAMQDQAIAREQAAKESLDKAKHTAALYERNAAALMARTATGDECSAAKALFNETLGRP